MRKRTITLLASAAVAAVTIGSGSGAIGAGPPTVRFSINNLSNDTDGIDICFSNVPKVEFEEGTGVFEPRLSGAVRIENAFTRNRKRPVRKSARSHGFNFHAHWDAGLGADQLSGTIAFFSDTYLALYDTDFGKTCVALELQRPNFAVGDDRQRMTQQGTLKFSVSYNALDSATGTSIRVAIGTATYRYSISYVPGYVAKEGSDLFFNYCLKQHPEKIVQSGGVLMCTTDSEIKYSLHRVWGK